MSIFPGIAVAGWLLLVVQCRPRAQALSDGAACRRPTPNYARLDAPEWPHIGDGRRGGLDLGGEQVAFIGRNIAIVCGAFFFIELGSHPSSDEEISGTIHGIERFLYFYNGFGLANVGCGRPRIFEQWAGFRLKYGRPR